MKKTKPRADRGYYCDLCKEMICKYALDWNACGGIIITRAFHVTAGKHSVVNHKDFEICQECARDIAQGVLDEY